MSMTGEQQRSQVRHQRILDAALDVFARRGYRDTAVDAIAPLDTELAGTAWFGALNEVVVRWVLTGRPERLDDAYPELRAFLLRSIGAPMAEAGAEAGAL